jgi:hypothetical protein
VASRFKTNEQRPLSRGVMMALHYEPWVAQGFEVKAVMPFSYAQGDLATLADGGYFHNRIKEKVTMMRHSGITISCDVSHHW